jgi:hypothetical protein
MGTSASFNPKSTPRFRKYRLHYFTNPLYLSFFTSSFSDVFLQITLDSTPSI